MIHTVKYFLASPQSWWRATYECRRGSIIPVAAPKPYDPWKAYGDARHGRRERPAPYQSLLRLVQLARYDSSGRPDAKTAEAVVRWCNDNGPLGVLLDRVSVLSLHPYWRTPDGVSSNQIRDRAARPVAAVSMRLVRQGANWIIHESILPGVRANASARVGEPALGLPAAQAAVGALVRELGSGNWRWEPVSETWGRFFPMTKDPTTHLYPPPGTVEFAAAYAEPVVEFLAAAATLRDALMAAATPTAAAADLTLLNRLHDNVVRHVVRGGNGAAELAWAAPSLLSAFAVMLVEDLVAGGTLHRCAECEAPFLSSAYQARFCTPTCRQTSAMRAYRQRGSTAAAPNKRLKIGDASRTRPAAKE